MRLEESKLFTTIVWVLSLLGNIYIFSSRGVINLPQCLMFTAVLIWQLRLGIIFLWFKRDQLSFHFLHQFPWRFEVDCALSMALLGLAPLFLMSFGTIFVKEKASIFLYLILYLLLILASGLSLLAETQAFQAHDPQHPHAFRLEGLWAYAWSIDYLAETVSLFVILALCFNSVLFALVISLLFVAALVFYLIPQREARIQATDPELAKEILESHRLIPYVY